MLVNNSPESNPLRSRKYLAVLICQAPRIGDCKPSEAPDDSLAVDVASPVKYVINDQQQPQ